MQDRPNLTTPAVSYVTFNVFGKDVNEYPLPCFAAMKASMCPPRTRQETQLFVRLADKVVQSQTAVELPVSMEEYTEEKVRVCA